MSTLGDIEVDEGEVHDAEGGSRSKSRPWARQRWRSRPKSNSARLNALLEQSRENEAWGKSTLLPRRLLGAWTSAS